MNRNRVAAVSLGVQADVRRTPIARRPTRTTALYLPTVAAAVACVALAWAGWRNLGASGAVGAIKAGDLAYIGPVVLGFVAVVIALEQAWPAQRQRLLSRGRTLDFGYLLLYALAVMPFVTLLGAGAATLLEEHAGWLVLPRLPYLPRWSAVVLGLLVIDATDWLAHRLNHGITPLWRLHAVHHSQEELSVLTTFRAHPLVHLTFAITSVPGFVLAANAATPTTLLIAYACLGALPHANLRWTYGPLRTVFISPAYHRIHHHRRGPLGVNLGVVFPFWDLLAGRARFPSSPRAGATGLAGRPIPVEQVGPARPARLLATQLLEPFTQTVGGLVDG